MVIILTPTSTGDSLQSEVVGIVVPDQETVTVWAKSNNIVCVSVVVDGMSAN